MITIRWIFLRSGDKQKFNLLLKTGKGSLRLPSAGISWWSHGRFSSRNDNCLDLEHGCPHFGKQYDLGELVFTTISYIESSDPWVVLYNLPENEGWWKAWNCILKPEFSHIFGCCPCSKSDSSSGFLHALYKKFSSTP